MLFFGRGTLTDAPPNAKSDHPPMHDAEQLPSIADEQTRRAQLRVGQLVRGRWKLDALLGVGGMAAVYRATHRNGKRVALKMLHNDLSTNTEVRQRFVDE